ncbi:GNAT family N-acetyltransferase [Brevibacillus invocatus]|uniref:GNAT family N-acetyltransferase n=1 Tax=Brevibacillus invocatus TaxID=173959 RepID=UPI00203C6636|nr:GNAT family N-acetyltransferase [Brevibacillus invocatus]MCM3079613.1 GNAT family N-acetyltransferase [Brevibacillus invocatus]MCM3429811.1 GNAT family N-acetyltransferase [Brevibacillus invocatus]
MDFKYITNDQSLSPDDFLDLAQDVWPGNYNLSLTNEALQKTINVTAWDDKTLIGCVRILSDGYFFGTIPEILVRRAYQGKGIGKILMELAWDVSPTSLFFGAQPGNEPFFEKLGYERSFQSFVKRKTRT